MAHTVESLSKLLKRTPDQVISILTAAGIQGKNANSNISADERQILMSSLSKRSSTKLNISVPRKTLKMSTTSSSTGGVKIQVKKKREDPIVSAPDVVNDEAVLKARDALEAGRLAEGGLLLGLLVEGRQQHLERRLGVDRHVLVARMPVQNEAQMCE